ncbi:MAG: glycosyltransferase family 2 protein [Methyloprofundus sp.]|nr:glycosyltransferase family 2 protein [Methyloprofundus sp.]
MVIDAFILCFNEAKMIRHTLNYYSKFCENITVIDNQSTDNTVEIIQEKFPDVLIQELDTGGEYREDIQIQTRNNCWKCSDADYVIMADMDEFIFDEDLVGKLELMHKNKIAVPAVIGINMVSDTFPLNYSLPITDQVKKGFRDVSFDKKILFSPKMIKEMNFGPGSHTCKPEFKGGSALGIDHSVQFKLLHFKYLGREHLYEKHRTYAKRMSEVNRENKFGYEYELGNEHVDAIFDRIDKHSG